MGVEQQEKEKKRRTMQMYNTIQQLVDALANPGIASRVQAVRQLRQCWCGQTYVDPRPSIEKL